jgi:uncharacterized membrane protein
MNIQTVASNLRNTIAGKVKHEAELEYALSLATSGERMALTATLAYLQINIGELKRILQDVEQCRPDWTPMNCPYAAAETCHRMD